MATTISKLTALAVATLIAVPAAAGDEVIIYQAGEEPRSGGTVSEKKEPTGEVIIYQGGEEPRSGGKVG